ncbi:hypothetical protein FACS1894120_5080 [Clostridia bacterium]|nr:hypothetical protein FACS1894120_5080 [Clostridia bacterium]
MNDLDVFGKRLEELRNNRETTEEIIDFINVASRSDDSEVRYLLAEALIDVPAGYSKSILLRLLYDTDKIVRVNAADTLGSFVFSDVLTELVRFLSIEKYSLARAYAVLSIGDILIRLIDMNNNALSKDVILTLHSLFINEKSSYVKKNYYRTFYLLGEECYFKRMIKGLDSIDYRIRCSTVNNLISVANTANIDEIKSELQKCLAKETAHSVVSSINTALAGLRKEQ